MTVPSRLGSEQWVGAYNLATTRNAIISQFAKNVHLVSDVVTISYKNLEI